MELIDRKQIEWYGCDFDNAACEERKCEDCVYAECSHDQVMELPIVPAIPIPEGATNGDVIKAMFPDLKIANDGLINDDLTGIIAFYGGYNTPLPRGDNYFNRKWWNAPYKRGNENGV